MADNELRSSEERKITIYDIAREAGVSPSTVSRVLTNTSGVGEAKRVLVQKIIDKYNFRPNALARGLSETRRKAIGIIMADVRNPFYSKLFVECERYARLAGYSLLLQNSLGKQDIEESQLQFMEEQRVDAVILVGGRVDDLHSCSEFVDIVNRVNNSIPVILTGRLDGTSCNQVRIDAIKAMDLVMDHLLELGHTRIAMVGGDDKVTASFEKKKRYLQILSRYHISVPPEYYDTKGGYDYDSGYWETERLLKLPDIPTAIIGINDSESIGAINCLTEHGFKVPEDVSVISYDNTYLSDLAVPKLTSIDYNYDVFAKTLIDTVEGIYASKDIPSVQLIEPRLVVRNSCRNIR